MSVINKKPRATADLESALVRVVRARGAVSRVDLARELKLVASTAGIYADRLIRDGFLVESKTSTRGNGRPPVLISLNPRAGRFIGVDFDARQVMAVAVDFDQRPLRRLRRTIPARANADRVLRTIEESIRELVGPHERDLLGIGLGVPGPVEPEQGIALRYEFIRDWHDVPVKPRIAEAFQAPVFVENNMRSMALGELWCGQGLGLRDLACLGVRSGIGSGIIVGGKLLRGASDLAGEIGRWSCPEDILPEPAVPGAAAARPRTIEDVASVTAILAQAAGAKAGTRGDGRGGKGDPRTVADLLAAADAGVQPARSVVERAAAVHAWIVHQPTLVVDPERVVIAGPLVEGQSYLDALQAALARLGGDGLSSRVVRSSLGPFAGALGAAALAFHHWRPAR
jgi:glucokinase